MNILKKSIAFLLILSLSLCVSGISFADSSMQGNGTPENPYQLSSADDLFWFAGLVNGTLTDGSEKNPSACAILTADIVLNENDLTLSANRTGATVWTPIGSDTNIYTGTFDGNGKSISGIYVTSNVYCGLFGYISGSVKNLSLPNTYIESTKGKYVGAVTGYANGAVISNCTSSGKLIYAVSSCNFGGIVGYSYNGSVVENCTSNVYFSNNGSRTSVISGGIVGYNNASSIKNCINDGEIVCFVPNSHVGGIAGYNLNGSYIIDCENKKYIASYDSGSSAGITARNDASTISGCINNGDVGQTFWKYVNVAGICVQNINGGMVKDCKNTHNIDASTASVGGIAVYVKDSTIENCSNEGIITGTYGGQAGGIIARAESNAVIKNCYNIADVLYLHPDSTPTYGGIAAVATVDATIENCYNSGVCEGGAILGNDKNTPVNCYYLADSETDTLDGTTFKTADSFASGEVCYLLNGDQSNIIFYQTLGTDLVPSFSGKQVFLTNGTYNN